MVVVVVFSSRSKKETGRGVNDDICRCVLLLLFSSSLQSAIGFMRKNDEEKRRKCLQFFVFLVSTALDVVLMCLTNPTRCSTCCDDFYINYTSFLKEYIRTCDEKRLNLST